MQTDRDELYKLNKEEFINLMIHYLNKGTESEVYFSVFTKIKLLF